MKTVKRFYVVKATGFNKDFCILKTSIQMKVWCHKNKVLSVILVNLSLKTKDSLTALKISHKFGILLNWEIWIYLQNLAQFDMSDLQITTA